MSDTRKRPKSLYCYKEKDVQKWFMSTEDNDTEFLLNILMNEDVDKSTLFSIPAEGLMFGLLWFREKGQIKRGSIWEFFKDYKKPQTEIFKNIIAANLAKEIEEENDFKHNSLFGFISPEGKYYHCDYQGHHELVSRICFGQFETNNPEEQLISKGWCKIYNPIDHSHRYAVYVDTIHGHTITNAQMNKLIELGLDKAKDISDMLLA